MSKIYKEHVIAFVDLLGFKEALDSNEMAEKILSILQKFKNGENPTSNSTLMINGQIHEIGIKPAITAFSDHLVISFSEEKLRGEISWRHAVIEILNIAQQLATIIIAEGFLLRGGITKGKLYHENGVVFGEALVEAYHLESSIANNPRIVASRKLYDCFQEDRNGWAYECFFQDEDGMYCLDYLPAMLSVTTDDVRKKFPLLIQENIKKLEGDHKKIKEYKKWRWFETYYNQCVSKQ